MDLHLHRVHFLVAISLHEHASAHSPSNRAADDCVRVVRRFVALIGNLNAIYRYVALFCLFFTPMSDTFAVRVSSVQNVLTS